MERLMTISSVIHNKLFKDFTVYHSIEGIERIAYNDGIITSYITEMHEKVVEAFDRYFDYKDDTLLKALPLNPKGTPFQKKVWNEISKIPIGEVRTYGQIAQELQTAALAVGTACGKNPIPLIVPCHRVVSAKGISKYSWGEGVETKKILLKHEYYLQ